MSVASLELCKELYGLSGWKDDVEHVYYSNGGIVDPENVWAQGNGVQQTGKCPCLRPRYLLRKLPSDNSLEFREGEWIAYWYHQTLAHDIHGDDAANPEDAAASLVIQLFKQGILTRDGDA